MIETTRILTDLVARPSINPMGRSLQGAEIYEHQITAYLENFFRDLGVPYERQAVAPLRDNIIARFERPSADRRIVLEAHQDTVPTDNMTIEPFAAKIEGGRLFGRGSCDIKGGMAAMLAAFARLVQTKPAGAASVIMASTVDEEHTSLGVKRLVDRLRADLAVVAEPTRLQIVNAHKGLVRCYISTTGRSCHSSTPEQGTNAIYRMGKLLKVIERYADVLRDSRTDPVLGPPTLSIGRIEGGTSVNTVPDLCRIEVDRRLIPGEQPRGALGYLERFLRGEAEVDFPFECSEPWIAIPALCAAGSEDLTARLGRAIDAVVGQHSVHAVPYGTDAATLAEAGIPSVVFGPGDIKDAHTCNESVNLREVEQAAEILYRLVSGE